MIQRPPSGRMIPTLSQFFWLLDVAWAIYQETIQGRNAIMATQAELQAALDRNTAATTQVGTAINAELAQLRAALDQLSTSTPPTQANLDQLNAASTALEAATASLLADDTTVTPNV